MTTFSITRPNGTTRTADMSVKDDTVTVRWNGMVKKGLIGGLDAMTVAELLLAELPSSPPS